jgi:hypothetical protein
LKRFRLKESSFFGLLAGRLILADNVSRNGDIIILKKSFGVKQISSVVPFALVVPVIGSIIPRSMFSWGRDIENTIRPKLNIKNLTVGYFSRVRGNPRWLSRNLHIDTIVSATRNKSHKPNELYDIAEGLAGPTSRKLELFGRQHNTRSRWLSKLNPRTLNIVFRADFVSYSCRKPVGWN